jgi:CIC family chloride channel protein
MHMAERNRNSRARLGSFARRSREIVGLSAVVGLITGLAVAGFERVVDAGLDELTSWPLWAAAAVPAVGLAATHVVVHAARINRETTDAYIRTYHTPGAVLPARSFPWKLLAAVTTLGSGGALGLEGPSLHMGATIGSVATTRLRRLLTGEQANILMVAGAAAGVAAIFKAPATGAVFAIEVPFREDFGRRQLLPALVGAACGYLSLVLVEGTTRLFPVSGSPAFDLRDLGGAIAIGVAAGVTARVLAWALRRAKSVASSRRPWVLVLVGGITLAGCAVASDALTGRPLSLGPGYDAIDWARDPKVAVEVVAGVLALRCIAVVATLGAGGVGGLFIPLVVAGDLLGRTLAGVFGAVGTPLFSVVGIAAVLGAGYRVPLAAVMFVAETTGQPGFVVPGILAAVVAELLMGSASVTRYQRGATV